MPKIGAEPDDRLYMLRCVSCGCMPLREIHDRVTPNGRAVCKWYDCPVHAHWQLCSDETRDGCKPERVYCTGCEGDATDNGAQQHEPECPLSMDPWADDPWEEDEPAF